MCGICAEIRFNNRPASLDQVQNMLEPMLSRGPDAGGSYHQNSVALGQRRLQIIDLSARGSQPMVDNELGLTIVFNGCIYNYKELRKDLEAKGYRFFSTSDTEVILKAYHAWPDKFLHKLNGMFAFVITERDSGKIFVARDRLGIKPLYYAPFKDGIRIASNVQALLATKEVDTSIDPIALHHYMSFHSVIPAPMTILQGIRRLPPASFMKMEPNGRIQIEQYWFPSYETKSEEKDYSFDDWKKLVHQELRDAVKRRMVADVPVGVLLSGGVDSSLVVGLLNELDHPNIETFSIGFESEGGEKGDEFEYSDIVVDKFKTKHHKIFVDGSHALDRLEECFKAMSEPMVSHDVIGFYLLSEKVSQNVKVVQSGQGADEVFGGYHWYPPMMESQNPVEDYAKVFFDRDHEEMKRALAKSYLSEDFSRDFVSQHFDLPYAPRPIEKALRLDSHVMLVDDPVKRVDNMTMAWGLEARVPFLDHKLVELAARVPAEHKIAKGGKHILKEVARSVIPKEVIDRPKGYFPVPALKYLKGDYLNFVKSIVQSDSAKKRNLFNETYVNELLKKPEEHITPLRGSKLWQLAVLEYWLQCHEI